MDSGAVAVSLKPSLLDLVRSSFLGSWQWTSQNWVCSPILAVYERYINGRINNNILLPPVLAWVWAANSVHRRFLQACDLLVTDLALNPSLSPVIDFSVPYKTAKLAILIKVRVGGGSIDLNLSNFTVVIRTISLKD